MKTVIHQLLSVCVLIGFGGLVDCVFVVCIYERVTGQQVYINLRESVCV